VAGIGGRVTVRKGALVVTLLIAVWMVGYMVLDRAPDATAYRTLCVHAAQSALDGLATARLVADEHGEASTLSTTATAMLDDASELLGEAASTLGGVEPPDDASVALRDQVTPLLAEANRVYGDVALARAEGDRAGWHAAVARIAPLEEQLRAFIEGHR
jgi:hypothetical protein